MSCLRAAVFGSVLVLTAAAAAPVSAQNPTDLAGSWQLDRDASQFPQEVGFSTTFVTGVPSDDTPGGTGEGGRRGGRGGGGNAGRTFEPRAQNETAEDASRVRFLTDEVRNPYERLSLTVTPDAVTIAPDRVAPRALRPGRGEEEVSLGPVSGVATTTWQAGRLVIAYKAETGRVVRYTYSLNQTPRQLIVDVEFIERGTGDRVRRVYVPATAMDTRAASSVAEPSTASRPSSPPPPGIPVEPAAADMAAVDQRPDAPLRGVTRLGVVVEPLNPDAETCGPKEAAIEAAVSKRLTDAGFSVARNSDEDTYLYVNINTVTASPGLCVSRYDVTIYSHTTGKLSHTAAPVFLQVELLHKGGLAGGSPAAHADGVTKGVIGIVEEFAARLRDASARRP